MFFWEDNFLVAPLLLLIFVSCFSLLLENESNLGLIWLVSISQPMGERGWRKKSNFQKCYKFITESIAPCNFSLWSNQCNFSNRAFSAGWEKCRLGNCNVFYLGNWYLLSWGSHLRVWHSLCVTGQGPLKLSLGSWVGSCAVPAVCIPQ